jgi:hypothetical protein
MFTAYPNSTNKSKMLLFIALIMLCAPKNGYSQAAKEPIVTLGEVDLTSKEPATYDQVLSDPELVPVQQGWEVQSFTLAYQPKGKPTFGPFKNTGSQLTAKEISILKNFKKEEVDRIKVYVEDIKAKGPDGTVSVIPPIVFYIVMK